MRKKLGDWPIPIEVPERGKVDIASHDIPELDGENGEEDKARLKRQIAYEKGHPHPGDSVHEEDD